MKYDKIVENILSGNYSSMIKNPKKRPEDYNQSALLKGTKIEMQTTPSLDLARKIAMQHLDEDEYYYDRLEDAPESPEVVERQGQHMSRTGSMTAV